MMAYQFFLYFNFFYKTLRQSRKMLIIVSAENRNPLEGDSDESFEPISKVFICVKWLKVSSKQK